MASIGVISKMVLRYSKPQVTQIEDCKMKLQRKAKHQNLPNDENKRRRTIGIASDTPH